MEKVYIVENGQYHVIPFESHSTCFSDVGQHTGISNSVGQVPLTSRRSYNFAPYEEAEKYDIYTENMDLGNRLDDKYMKEGIGINLSGQKLSFLGN